MAPSQTKILVVDDSLDMLTSICKILEIHGFSSDMAYNGSDALRKIEQTEYDLILCDIEMQGVTGLDFLERIRENLEKNLEVVMMTGFLEHEYYVRAIQLGASDFLSKPIDSKVLVETIQKVLDKRKKKKLLSDYYQYADKVALRIEIKPGKFSKFSLSRVVYAHLNQNFNLPVKLVNQILTCLDEMSYNAFIHGTLGLSHSERALDSDQLGLLIKSKLDQEQTKNKRILFILEINNADSLLKMSIEDDGPGFDYSSWLKQLSEDTEPLQEHGRGIALLYHFADKLEYSQGGRKATIIKKLEAR